MKRVKKGQFGYIKYRRGFHLILAIIMFAMAVILYFAGIKATGNNKNLLTVAAILGCLPASQSLVTAILGFRAKCCTKELFDKIKGKLEENMVSVYDLYFTGRIEAPIIKKVNQAICISLDIKKEET